MKKTLFMLGTIVFLFGTLLVSCTDHKEDSEPGVIETFTEKTADEITTSIKRPLNKARAVRQTGQDRMKGLDEMVKE